jgi:hypothetical protein
MNKLIFISLIAFMLSGCQTTQSPDWFASREPLDLQITTDGSWIATIGDNRYTGDSSVIISLGKTYTCWNVVKTSSTGILIARVYGLESGKVYFTRSVSTAHNPVRGCI